MAALLGAALFAIGGAPGCGTHGRIGAQGGRNAGTNRIRDVAAFQAMADYLDNPDRIFKEAGYTALWTVPEDQAYVRLDGKLISVPHGSRVWEPWFRNTLKDGERVLSTAELLRLRSAVGAMVNLDPRTEWRGPPAGVAMDRLCGYIAARIDDAVKETTREAGVSHPSRELACLLDADGVTNWIALTGAYDPTPGEQSYRERRWRTGNEILAGRIRVQSAEAAKLGADILRAVADLKGRAGLGAYPIAVTTYNENDNAQKGGTTSGAMLGVIIPCSNGEDAKMYYDCAPFRVEKDATSNRNLASFIAPPSKTKGPIDRAAVELLAATERLDVLPLRPECLGAHPRSFKAAYIGGERQDLFTLGNGSSSERRSSPTEGITKSGWTQWHESNGSKIHNLRQTFDRIPTSN